KQDNINLEAHVTREKTPSGKTKKISPRLMIGLTVGILAFLMGAFFLMKFISADEVSLASVGSGDGEVVLDVPETSLDGSIQELEDTSPEPLSGENVEAPQEEITTENVLIFSEDFDSDDTIAVPVFPDEYMHFFRPKGFGYIESTSYTGVLPIMFPEIKLDDFIVEFDFKMPEAFDDSRCGLIFRSDTDIADGLDEYYALFLYPKINQVKMGVWIDDDWASSEYMNPAPPFYQSSDLNHVKLEVSGGDQKVYINGVFLANFNNQALKEPGLIGLFLYPSDAIDEGEVDYVFFDNVQVFEN
ncbi:MAG: hypothetical protein DRN81_06395, partial [Thermoproteota archaeon]